MVCTITCSVWLLDQTDCDESLLIEVNHQLESRMREIRQSGSEGGGPNSIGPSYPYPSFLPE
jgi:hypothetical protein